MASFLEGRFDCGDEVVGSGGAGGEADGVFRMEPIGAKIGGRLDVMDTGAEAGAGLDELAGVVAVRPANDDDDVATSREFLGGDLALFSGLADGIDETDFGGWKTRTKSRDEFANRAIGWVV